MIRHAFRPNGFIVAILVALAWANCVFGGAAELKNQFLRVTVEDGGAMLVLRRHGETSVVAQCALALPARDVAPAVRWPIPGIGDAQAMTLKTASGPLRLGLVDGIPLVFIQAGISNESPAAKRIERFDLLDFRLLPGTPLHTLRVLGTGGLSTVDTRAVTRRRAKNPNLPPATKDNPNGSYMFLAVAFGARERIDETVQRIRTVRDARWRCIRNYTPGPTFASLNRYKEKCFLAIPLVRELQAQGKLAGPPAELTAMRGPSEELYDLDADPHEVHNLFNSGRPEHREALVRLRAALDTWITETGDRGEHPEPADVVAPFEKEMHDWFGTPSWYK